MKILFCQLRNHGDVIRTFPLLESIKVYHPDWYIGFTCYHEMVETCQMSKHIDVIIEQPRLAPVTEIQGGTRILDCNIFNESVGIVRRIGFDVFVDLHGVFQSAVFGAMCDIKVRLGRSSETAKDGAALFYTDICQIVEKEVNRMERHFIVFNKLFPEVRPLNKIKPKSNRIIIFPGSSKMGMLKRWKIERYAEIGERLRNRYEVLFILGPEEQDIKKTLQDFTLCSIYIDSDWSQVESELEDCKLVIGNDGAYLHLAIWKGIPAVMVCGPLSPTINGVWKYGRGEAVYSSEYCKCPAVWEGICHNAHKCMEQISVNDVMEAVEKYL